MEHLTGLIRSRYKRNIILQHCARLQTIGPRVSGVNFKILKLLFGAAKRCGLCDSAIANGNSHGEKLSCSQEPAPGPTATTKYVAGVVPTFLIPCSSLERTNPTEPGPRRWLVPLTVSSTVPSRMSHISECT